MNRVQPTQTQQQQQQSLPRYQNTSTFPRQQQQQQHTPQFLNLPQTQGRNHEFLLQVNEDDPSYNFLNTSQQLPLDFSTSSQNIIQSECNIQENNEDEEDDTTSEEIKRNLLVNALKNDKFTTKFYESIKEDVFRRLESMLLDKDNASQAPSSDIMPQLFNNINSHSLRKLNLNEQMDQMQSTTSFEATNMQQNVSDDSNTRNDFPRNVANDDNGGGEHENEKPEEDTNWRQNNMNNCGANSSTSLQTGGSGSTNTTTTTTTTTKNCTKKRKNLRKQPVSNSHNNVSTFIAATDDHHENLRGACSLAAQNHQIQQQINHDKVVDSKHTSI